MVSSTPEFWNKAIYQYSDKAIIILNWLQIYLLLTSLIYATYFFCHKKYRKLIFKYTSQLIRHSCIKQPLGPDGGSSIMRLNVLPTVIIHTLHTHTHTHTHTQCTLNWKLVTMGFIILKFYCSYCYLALRIQLLYTWWTRNRNIETKCKGGQF